MDNKIGNMPGMAIKKEQQNYEEAQKNLRIMTAKLRLAQQYGIDTSKLSQQKLDRALRFFDEMEKISVDARNKISEIQREGNIEIQKINQRVDEKYSQVSKDIDNFIKSLKESQPIIDSKVDEQQIPQVVIPIVEKKEKTFEERASGLADLILEESKEKLKDEILEILKKAQDTAKTTGAIMDVTTRQGEQIADKVIEKVETIEKIKTEEKNAAGVV